MVSKIVSGAVIGVEGYLVDVEVDITQGLPSFDIVGLPDSSVKESRERVRSAIKNSDYPFPVKRITINLAPADTKKEGPSFDLPIAIGILVSMDVISHKQIENTFVTGELSLDGKIRPVTGVLPMIYNARKNNIKKCFVPFENAEEAALVDGIEVYGVSSLHSLLEHLQSPKISPTLSISIKDSCEFYTDLDFSDVKGQESVKRALEVAAAGYHNLIMIGPPGSGKTMLAKRMPTILPNLNFEESINVTKIYSVVGMLENKATLVTKRPFRAPHHTISYAALVGGGRTLRPGEISLAHNGVLFLDELTEFHKNVLEVLRQPLEDGYISIARANNSVVYPSDFMLLASMNPCPCGYYGDSDKCSCSPNEVSRYIGKISGPLLDRIDIQIEALKVNYEELNYAKTSDSSETIRERVQKAHTIQRERFKNENITYNSQLSAQQIQKYCPLGETENMILKQVFDSLDLSARAYHKILKLARTIADLDAQENITPLHLTEAIQYRSLDRKYWS